MSLVLVISKSHRNQVFFFFLLLIFLKKTCLWKKKKKKKRAHIKANHATEENYEFFKSPEFKNFEKFEKIAEKYNRIQ